MSNLALWGSEPAFEKPLHVGRPNIGDREALQDRLNGILDRCWLSNNGICVQEFEKRIAELCGVEHCIAVCNGTIGLEIAIRALGLEGEVIVPSFTFISTAHALRWLGVRPVFADVDPNTHCLCPESVASVITPRTTGIIAVHLWGQPADHAALQALADEKGLNLIFDAAHAFASRDQDQRVGGFGKMEVFSFHATKFINSLEGGAILTNDADLAAACRLMINFGFTGPDCVEEVGTNGKMNEFSAAMGLTSLDSLDDFLAINRRNYDLYRKGLADIPGIDLLEWPDPEAVNCQYIVAMVDGASGPLHRDELLAVLQAENALARRYFYPGIHRMKPYADWEHAALPHTDTVSDQVLVLPTGQSMDPSAINRICQIIRTAQENPDRVRTALKSSQAG